eukprot:GHVR01139876.1.p1 GENE.GHVR01139876.1~~GHVR01139876.1.p1  ORF type:complete len:448 (-),score=145.21 GHVR01139876.1:195-1505(-)
MSMGEDRDCQVSDWTPRGSCSASCGGGTKVYTREVLTQSFGTYGARCPPLAMEVGCNTHECPQNCITSEWSAWSACSSLCSVGTTYRARAVERPAVNRGVPCGALEEGETCVGGGEWCDKDCRLSDEWTEWSLCSRACGGGERVRHKYVIDRERGWGYCPSGVDSKRLQVDKCNNQRCPLGVGVCVDVIDLVVLLDSSGSVGQDGWTDQVKAIKRLVKLLKFPLVHLSLIVYSSQVHTHIKLSGDSNYIDTRLNSLDKLWFGRLTATGSALETARMELVERGRHDALQVVLILTESLPNKRNERVTSNQSSDKLKKMNVRVVAIHFDGPNTSDHFNHIINLASPGKFNFFRVDTHTNLESGMEALVTVLCRDLKFENNPQNVIETNTQAHTHNSINTLIYNDTHTQTDNSTHTHTHTHTRTTEDFPSGWHFANTPA